MQLAEADETTSKVINLSDGVANGPHDGCTMFFHLRGVRTEIRPVGKVSLGLRVYSQHPVKENKEESMTRINSMHILNYDKIKYKENNNK